jgi:hypothetical protein
LKYLQTFPNPNTTTANFQQNFRAQRQSVLNFDDFDIRVDFNATQKDQIFFRYSYGQDNFTVTNRLGSCCPSGFGSGDNIAHPRGIAAGYTRTITNTLLNEFRFGYTSTVYGYNPPNIGQQLAAGIGIPGANPTALLGGQALIGGNNGELEYQGDGGPYNVPQILWQITPAQIIPGRTNRPRRRGFMAHGHIILIHRIRLVVSSIPMLRPGNIAILWKAGSSTNSLT